MLVGQPLPVLSEEVDDVERVSVHHSDGQVEHRLSVFLTDTNAAVKHTQSNKTLNFNKAEVKPKLRCGLEI